MEYAQKRRKTDKMADRLILSYRILGAALVLAGVVTVVARDLFPWLWKLI
jgi:hypothetical protein